MTKLMFAVWGEALAGALHDPALHAELAGHGVRRLQLNVDDEHVAPAMRIPTEEPIGAVVSTWTDEPLGADGVRDVVASLAGRASRVAGWRVEEFRRPTELTHPEWLRRWQVEHTGVAIRTQATTGYVQNLVVEAVTPGVPGEPAVSALVEELFPMAGMTDVHAFYGSGGDDAELTRRLETLMASVRRIGADRDLDLVPTSRYLLELG